MTTALCPVPIHRLPFCVRPVVPPARERSAAALAVDEGSAQALERPTKTQYPVVGPAQQFAVEANRYYQPPRRTTYAPSNLLSIATLVSARRPPRVPSRSSSATEMPP